MHFVHALKEDRIFQILEERVRSKGSNEQLMAIAQLVKKCLKFKGEDRPTMKEVVVDLQGLRGLQDHPWVDNEENERFSYDTLRGSTSSVIRYSVSSPASAAKNLLTFKIFTAKELERATNNYESHKIVGQAAALTYLHDPTASMLIFHGDVKSSNILLDNNFTSKVKLKVSRLVHISHRQIITQGTFRYLD
ncbi:putative wall-associated receptor kinase-like protein 16 [Cinnamomum micranthum f. kanehirae]|uniref:Putative wall-associated receptor kinase-like protein 16 n=1 Tax=Cinnamomum micranthum f. kanehirae TaxID=337451 RepID=A0A443N7T9_9MAGN|nr:putative wall-associated receptor kinase-like protein 16 [Cinnamomum micranthum f. kanehirae]